MAPRVPLLALALALVATACPADEPEPPPEPAPTPAPTPTPEEPEPEPEPEEPDPVDAVGLRQIASLREPLGLAVREGDEALYVAQKTGQIVALQDGDEETVLDIGGEVSGGYEQGLLGLAFSPDGGFLYLHYTDTAGDSRIQEFEVDDDGVAMDSRREVMHVEQPYANHNCGHLAFGPDGYLYVCMGDGGRGGDPHEHGQNIRTRLGAMLRISPRPEGGDPYGIPEDNPFVGEDGRPEIWAYGLRNPWRFSFDRETGDLWIADVGQDSREEINFQPADSEGGENYGWARMEGTMPFRGEEPPDHVPPVHEYEFNGRRTVIGGYVYRGEAIPGLRGTYLFGDLFVPELQGLILEDGRAEVRGLEAEVENLVAFGQDHDGELYAISLSGPIFRIVGP
jgi:glucose/arabinose dehydrogenase